MRLASYFGGDARSWLNWQAAYDLRVAEWETARRIEREETKLPVEQSANVVGFRSQLGIQPLAQFSP